jgi:hypothetical protein
VTGYYFVEPEVAGGLGENTVLIRMPGRPVIVHELHYRFDGWLGDALVESTPCYIVTGRLAAEIAQSGLTGAGFDTVEISKSGQFDDLYPHRELPEFVWLKIEGMPGRDDFGTTSDMLLVVSERALAVLKASGIAHAHVARFES